MHQPALVSVQRRPCCHRHGVPCASAGLRAHIFLSARCPLPFAVGAHVFLMIPSSLSPQCPRRSPGEGLPHIRGVFRSAGSAKWQSTSLSSPRAVALLVVTTLFLSILSHPRPFCAWGGQGFPALVAAPCFPAAAFLYMTGVYIMTRFSMDDFPLAYLSCRARTGPQVCSIHPPTPHRACAKSSGHTRRYLRGDALPVGSAKWQSTSLSSPRTVALFVVATLLLSILSHPRPFCAWGGQGFPALVAAPCSPALAFLCRTGVCIMIRFSMDGSPVPHKLCGSQTGQQVRVAIIPLPPCSIELLISAPHQRLINASSGYSRLYAWISLSIC